VPRFSDDPERTTLLRIGSSKPRLFCTNIESPLFDGSTGRARFELGQKTKKEIQKVKKWIIKTTNGDLRTREKENREGE